MISMGILAPDAVPSLRRQQNLGLAAAVRHFNDRAAPGLGRMWFPMPLLWSVLAVSIAEELRRPALPVGNAIEALMMAGAKSGDPRVRGARKMEGLTDKSFRNLQRRGTYVIQPTRMAMVQPLVALGFVQGARYGAFRIDDAGRQMLASPEMTEYRRILMAWTLGNSKPSDLRTVTSALSPTGTIPPSVCKLIRARLIEGDSDNTRRRRNLIALESGPSSEQLNAPNALSPIDPVHWADMRAGAAFIDLRDSALHFIERLEELLQHLRDGNEPARMTPEDVMHDAESQKRMNLLRIRAQEDDRIEAAGEKLSCVFLDEIRNLPMPQLLQRLAERDGTVVAWRENQLVLGPAGGDVRSTADEDAIADEASADNAFAPQLFRLYNLHCLWAELSGRANPKLHSFQVEEGA